MSVSGVSGHDVPLTALPQISNSSPLSISILMTTNQKTNQNKIFLETIYSFKSLSRRGTVVCPPHVLLALVCSTGTSLKIQFERKS